AARRPQRHGWPGDAPHALNADRSGSRDVVGVTGGLRLDDPQRPQSGADGPWFSDRPDCADALCLAAEDLSCWSSPATLLRATDGKIIRAFERAVYVGQPHSFL